MRVTHPQWKYGLLATYRSAGRNWHTDCKNGGRLSEVWTDSCGCRYCTGCHTVQTGERCGPDSGEAA